MCGRDIKAFELLLQYIEDFERVEIRLLEHVIFVWRLDVTLSLLLAPRLVFFLARGRHKKQWRFFLHRLGWHPGHVRPVAVIVWLGQLFLLLHLQLVQLIALGFVDLEELRNLLGVKFFEELIQVNLCNFLVLIFVDVLLLLGDFLFGTLAAYRPDHVRNERFIFHPLLRCLVDIALVRQQHESILPIENWLFLDRGLIIRGERLELQLLNL